MSPEMRQYVTRLVQIQNPIADQDINNYVQTDLVALLQRLVDTSANGGLQYHLLLTSIKLDHRDDRCLGPHSHYAGFAVDIGTIDGNDVGDNPETEDFVKDCAGNNKWVTKIGLGGPSKIYMNLASQYPSVVFFEDNDEPHIHLQTI